MPVKAPEETDVICELSKYSAWNGVVKLKAPDCILHGCELSQNSVSVSLAYIKTSEGIAVRAFPASWRDVSVFLDLGVTQFASKFCKDAVVVS